ncbi:MAG: hypothetical protein EXR71_14260 [Myxococcales bacterium]|nr:hypothetical protein [Myxococcales bacterium]
MVLGLLLACPLPEDSAAEAPVGALGLGRTNPFPSVELVEDGRLAFAATDLPLSAAGQAWDLGVLGRRTGFSPVQPAIVRFEQAVDEASVSGPNGVATNGTVRLVDLDSGEALPCFAELDAATEAMDSGLRTLIVRPMVAMTSGHRIAVVVTSGVTSQGVPLPVPAPTGHYAELVAELAALGQDDVVLAWDFPVQSYPDLVDGALARAAAPGAHTIDWTWETGGEIEPPPGLWRLAEGSFVTTEFLVDGTRLALDEGGLPVAQGERAAYLMVAIPEAVRDAAPGSAPVVIFGHGILSEPDNYLHDGDPSALIALANGLGAIVVATKWTGLTADDQLHALEVASDFARFHEVPEMLVQGVVDTRALAVLLRDGALLADPLFAGLADPATIWYYGISLGGIEGAVTLANQDVVSRGVLHVGGAAWATMLERSSNWPPFDIVVTRTFPDPWDRQLLYATTQLYWDSVDPATYADRLAGGTWLWQQSMGDEQVPNVTTELLARSVGLPLGTPAVTTPLGLAPSAMPLTGAALTQFDPEVEPPDATNRPASRSGAHAAPRMWEGTQAQAAHFLRTGEVAHFCGEAPCSASNPGSW